MNRTYCHLPEKPVCADITDIPAQDTIKSGKNVVTATGKKQPNGKSGVIAFIIAAIIHAVIFFTLTFPVPEKNKRNDVSVFKIVDITEYRPREEKKEEKEKKLNENTLETRKQPAVAETILETDKQVIESDDRGGEIEFLPQHRISVAPVIPADLVKSRIKYPTLANLQKIEGVVFLELFIDSKGIIRKINILKDPGYGLAEAAVKALDGIVCAPALANGKAVAVRYRYPVRFVLK